MHQRSCRRIVYEVGIARGHPRPARCPTGWIRRHARGGNAVGSFNDDGPALPGYRRDCVSYALRADKISLFAGARAAVVSEIDRKRKQYASVKEAPLMPENRCD